MPSILRIGLPVVGICILVAGITYLVRAFDSRSMPALAAEHRIHFSSEFAADDETAVDWAAYLAIEEALARELADRIDAVRAAGNLLDRHWPDSMVYPPAIGGNWNRSYQLSSVAPRGTAVLLHGLSDSPYSMLATAQTLVGAGYNVVVPRLPGHGFAVGGLRQSRWQDWAAAVRIAVRQAMTLPGSDGSFVLAGYSNGGLLALHYALSCADDGMPCPERLLLLSPALAVSPVAAVANWHAGLSWLPYFERFAWMSILPEIDPFKFTSFPKRAGREIHRVTRRVHRMLGEAARREALPPVLTFQSVIDNTVSSRAVAAVLYERLPANGSHLVVYDVNRNSTIVELMLDEPPDPLDFFRSGAPRDYDVTVIGNASRSSLAIRATTLAAGDAPASAIETGLMWPPEVYSLSHVALPFRSDDPVYGNGADRTPPVGRIVIGALSPRGEPGLLRLPAEFFQRTRYNVFYALQDRMIVEWLAGG